MLSRWKAALISSAAAALMLAADADAVDTGRQRRTVPAGGLEEYAAAGRKIAGVDWSSGAGFDTGYISRGTLLEEGAELSALLIAAEMSRIDSLMFAAGFAGAEADLDTSSAEEGVRLAVSIDPGGRSVIGSVSVSGSADYDAGSLGERFGIRAGEEFDPSTIGDAMRGILGELNSEGFPYAQVWLSGFEHDRESGSVDLSFAVYGGEESVVSSVVFDGLAKTDTSLAMRHSRIEPGRPYDERKVITAGRYLASSGLFSSVGEAEVLRESAGKVVVRIPVEEKSRASSVQGMFGFSRRPRGEYRTSGAVDVDLRNIGGTGRDASFEWIDDGEGFRTTSFEYAEPFVAGLPFHLESRLRQEVYDTLYDFTLAGGSIRYPASPSLELRTGVTRDSNVPAGGALERSTRWRFMLGAAIRSGRASAELEIEGAARSRESGGGEERDGQLLYSFDSDLNVPLFAGQSLHARAVLRGTFSSGGIPAAELYPLGGARSLRGYRENQFRGEKIGWLTLEYRFGGQSRFFIFDDAGFFRREGEGWTFKNGAGFGLRSSSALGTVELSFGVGERLSLEQTRIHIALIENF